MTQQLVPQERLVGLGPFVVDTSSGEITKNGRKMRLQEQPTRLLLALLKRPGELVTQEELRAQLWPDDTNVEFNHSIHAAINRLRQALEDSSDQPKFVETVPRRGYRLIVPISLVPDQHPTEAFVGKPTASQVSPSTGEGPVPSGTYRTAIWAGLSLMLVLAASLAAILRHSKSKVPSASVALAAPTISVPQRVAVIGFRNLSNRGDNAWLSTALSEMLATELGASAALQPVSGEDVAQMKRELALNDADSYAHPTLTRIRNNLGAELIVVGSFLQMGTGNPQDELRFDVHLQDTDTGKTVVSLAETGTVSQLFNLVSDAGLRLRAQLGATSLSSSEQAEIRQSMSSDNEAQRLYFMGLERLRQSDFVNAREVLMKAVAADQDNSLAHLALSSACTSTGYDLQAAKEAKAAFNLTKGLTYEQGLRVEGRYYETKHDWLRAEQIYQRLWKLSPRTIGYPIHLAYVQVHEGKSADAVALLDQLQRIPRSISDDARIYRAKAHAEQGLGDFKKQLAAAEAAATLGMQAGAPIITATARMQQAIALHRLGQDVEALNAYREAQNLFESVKDAIGLANVLTGEANILFDRGDVSEAETTYARSLALARTAGNRQAEATISTNLGNILLNRGETGAARIRYQSAYEVFRDVGQPTGEVVALQNIGDSWFYEGRLSRAKQYYQRSVQLAKEIADEDAKAFSLEGLGRVLLGLGDLEGAKRALEESLGAAQSAGDKLTETAGLVDLGNLMATRGSLSDAQSTTQKALANADRLANKSLLASAHLALGRTLSMEGDLTEARSNYGQALALDQSLHAATQENETRYLMAELAIAQSRPSEARETLRLLRAELERKRSIDSELQCLILQAQIALLENHRDQLQQLASRAQAAAAQSERVELQFPLAEVLAESASASGHWAEADRIITSALLRASKSGCVVCELEARFSQCSLKAEKDAAGGSLCFEQLRQRAQARGFGLVARNATLKLRFSATPSVHP